MPLDLSVWDALDEQIARDERKQRLQLHRAGKQRVWGHKASDKDQDHRREVTRVRRFEIKHSCVERRREQLGGRGNEVEE